MGQQGFVVTVVRVDDNQALADGEASRKEQQAGVEDHADIAPNVFQVPGVPSTVQIHPA